MTKKSRRNVVFEDSDENSAYQYESNNTIHSDEGECDASDGGNMGNIAAFDDGYDEDLMGDDNDRSTLNAMTEVEREKELFKRMERREALKARLVIEQRLKAANNNKEQSSSSVRGEKNVRPKRNLIKPGQQSIDLIRNRRMKRKIVDTHHQLLISDDDDNNKKVSSRWSRNGSDDDDTQLAPPANKKLNRKERYLCGDFSGDQSEEDFDDTFNKRSLTPITTLEEFNKLRISRHKLSLWIHQPFFERRIPGFFVRFANVVSSQSNNNDDTEDHQSIYQIFEIIEILKSNKPYKLGDFVTNKYLRVRRGDEERMIRIEYVSNQWFTESEFVSYIKSVENDDQAKPTIETVDKKQADLKYCINFRPNEQDIDHIVEQKNKFRKVPVNITAEKHRVQIKIENARQQNDMQLVHKLEDDVRRLDEHLEQIHENRSKDLDKIRVINERNRKSNIAQLEKVLEDESTSNTNNSTTSTWVSNHDTTEFINNPFVRRRTNPIMLSDRKVHDNLSNKLKQRNLLKVEMTNNNKSSSTVASTTTTNDGGGGGGNSQQSNTATTVESNIISSTTNTHHPYDISKDLENLYDFELDICLDIQPQQPPNSQQSKSRFT